MFYLFATYQRHCIFTNNHALTELCSRFFFFKSYSSNSTALKNFQGEGKRVQTRGKLRFQEEEKENSHTFKSDC